MPQLNVMPPALLLRKPLWWSLPLLVTAIMCAVFCDLVSAAQAPKQIVPPAHGKTVKQKHSIEIPFDYDRISMPCIVVQASINGHPPLPFVVDTGSFNFLLSVEPWAAKKLDLPLLTTNDNQSVPGQGQKTLTNTIVKTVRILGIDGDNNCTFNLTAENKGGTKKGDTPFQIVGILDGWGDSYRRPQPAGIIPLDLLRLPRMIWQIDFQRKVLVFIQKTKEWKPAAGSFVVPLNENSSSECCLTHAVLPMGKTLDFMVDTGSPGTSMQNMAVLPILEDQSAKEAGDDPNRKLLNDVILLPRFQIGDLIEPNVAVRETSAASATSSANILGMDFLSRFLVTLDLAENKMYLKRRSDYALQAAPEATSRVRLEKRADQYDVAWIEPVSPAYAAGLRVGDRVKQVDGQPLDILPFPAARGLLDGFEGTTAKLKVRTVEGKEVAYSFSRSKKFLGRRHALLGVSLDWVQGNLMVSGVTTGSPLEHTLKWGDDLYSINDQPVAKMTMDKAFQHLERPDLALQVWRDADKTWQELHLAPLPLQTQVLVGPLPAVSRYSFGSKTGWTPAPL